MIRYMSVFILIFGVAFSSTSWAWEEAEVIRAFYKTYSDETQAMAAMRLVTHVYTLKQGNQLWSDDWSIDHENKIIYIADDSTLFWERSNENAADQLYQILSDVFYETTGLSETWEGFFQRECGAGAKCATGITSYVGGAFLLAAPEPTMISKVAGYGAIACGTNELVCGATQVFRRAGGIDLIQDAVGFCGNAIGGEDLSYSARYWTSWGQFLFLSVGLVKGARFVVGKNSSRELPAAFRQAHQEAFLLDYAKANGIVSSTLPGQATFVVADSTGQIQVLRFGYQVTGAQMVEGFQKIGIDLAQSDPVVFATGGPVAQFLGNIGYGTGNFVGKLSNLTTKMSASDAIAPATQAPRGSGALGGGSEGSIRGL